MKKSIMRKYARLAVRSGVSLKKGQGCVITCEVEQFAFARMVEEEAYRAGAKWVQLDWLDQPSQKLKFRHETVTQLSKVAKWEEEKRQYYVDTLPAMVHIVSEDPDGLKGVNVEKMQKASAARARVLKKYRDAMDSKYQWTIVAVPSKKWAKKVFPDDRGSVAVEKLWNAILMSVRVSETNDPVEEWDKHNAKLHDKCKKLDKFAFEYLEYKDKNGTDFKVWLNPKARWGGGGDWLSTDRTFYNPNMPTEEVFTTPLKDKCEGTLVATMPLSFQGNLIEDFSVTFKDGKAVKCKAKANQELLEKMIAMDEGAGRLGELALVPDDSPISNSGILFYNTLFDENAACHVALGFGFDELIENYENMTKEEIKATGVNDSIIHVDFMIGSKNLNVTGYKNGKATPILKNGNWAI